MHEPLQQVPEDAGFDPFGDPFGAPSASVTAAKPSARRLAQLGAGLFWLMVVVILAARLAYVVPAFGRVLDGAAGLLP